MKVFKPDSLGLLHRGIRFARKNQLSIGMMAFFPLNEAPGVALLPEAQMWKVAAEAIGSDAIMDEGLPKPAGEFLVFGAAHAPSGGAAPEVAVSVQVGGLSKTLRVSGDRHFNALGVITGPKPFTQMVISPQTAFGGPGSADNPSGKGLVKLRNPEGNEGLPLPNVEHMAKLVLKPGDEAPAAGFWSLPPDSPLRKQHLGTFNDAWLKTGWPHLPDDTQPAYFNVAPADQRIGGFFRGDEKIVVHNMHPQRALISSALPQLRARCFVNRRVAGGEEFVEVTARAETVWLFPGQGCGIALYRAVTPTANEDAEDILHVMAEWESMADTPLSFSHYQEEFLRRLPQSAQGAAATAADPAFAPANAPSAAMPAAAVAVPALAVAVAPEAAAGTAADFLAANPELQEVHRLAAELNKNTQETMQKHGITQADLAPYLKEAPEPPVQSLEAVEKMAADLQAHTRELMQKHNLTDKDLAPFMPKPEVESANPLGDMKKALLDLQANTRETMQKTGLTQADIDAFISKSPEMADVMGKPAPDIDAVMAGLAAVMPAAMPAAMAAPVAMPGLPIPDSAPEPDVAVTRLTRDEVVTRHAGKKTLAGFDLSGLDLSGLDLAGADFSLALLEKTSFKDGKLGGANFKDALLAGGDFSGADLSGALLTGASAGSAVFAKAQLEGARAGKADFTGADFSEAQMGQCDIAGATFDGAKMAGLKAAKCNARQASFADCDLGAADFTGACLTAAAFTSAKLAKAIFFDSACDNAEFQGADATLANFSGANLKASRADATSQFAGANLGKAQLGRAAWEGAQLVGADLQEAVLDGADFSRTQATDARFGRASAKGAKFDKADISRADFTGVNLFKGSMRSAKIEATLLRKANLYGVDFYGTSPTIASLEGSNIDQTLLVVRKPVV